MAKIDKADIISIALAAPKIVAAFRALFGKNKTGAEKKKIATETLADGVALAEGVAGKDLLNDGATQVLLAEAIQISYDIMKLKDRLAEIDDLVKAVRGTGQPN